MGRAGEGNVGSVDPLLSGTWAGYEKDAGRREGGRERECKEVGEHVSQLGGSWRVGADRVHIGLWR